MFSDRVLSSTHHFLFLDVIRKLFCDDVSVRQQDGADSLQKDKIKMLNRSGGEKPPRTPVLRGCFWLLLGRVTLANLFM